MKTVKEILELPEYTGDISPSLFVHKYLEDHGFDGLCGDDCGCGLDDLCPCDDGEYHDGIDRCECVAGYIIPCDCGDHDFHITPDKKRAEDILESLQE